MRGWDGPKSPVEMGLLLVEIPAGLNVEAGSPLCKQGVVHI